MSFVGQPTVVKGGSSTPEREALNTAHTVFNVALEVWDRDYHRWVPRSSQFVGNKLAHARLYRVAQGARHGG